MSRLEYYSRPLVAFDPTNREHRRYYAEFIKFQGWGQCPVRFIVTEEHANDLPTMIRNKLCEYYIQQEFKKDKLKKTRQRGRTLMGLTSAGYGVILEV